MVINSLKDVHEIFCLKALPIMPNLFRVAEDQWKEHPSCLSTVKANYL